MASQGSHQSLSVGMAIKYNMTQEYSMENSLGVRNYVYPLGRFIVRIDDHKNELRQEVSMSIQGDGYMNLYATMYLIVEDPQRYNHWEITDDKNKEKSPMVEVEVPPNVDPNLF